MSCLFSFLSGLAKAQKTFSQNLIDFKFECIGQQQTDDEIIICKYQYQTKVGLELSPLIFWSVLLWLWIWMSLLSQKEMSESPNIKFKMANSVVTKLKWQTVYWQNWNGKQCRSWWDGSFVMSRLIWIYTVCKACFLVSRVERVNWSWNNFRGDNSLKIVLLPKLISCWEKILYF